MAVTRNSMFRWRRLGIRNEEEKDRMKMENGKCESEEEWTK